MLSRGIPDSEPQRVSASMQKLRLTTRAELVRNALEQGLLDADGA